MSSAKHASCGSIRCLWPVAVFAALGMLGVEALTATLSRIAAQEVVGGQCGVCGQWYLGSHSCSGWSAPERYSPPNYSNDPAPSVESAESRARRLSIESNNTGVDFAEAGDHFGALRFYRLALEHDPENRRARSNLNLAQRNISRAMNNAGAAQIREGNTEEAIRLYRMALDYWPDNPVAQKNFDQVLGAIEDRERRNELERKFAESRKKISNILDELRADFDDPNKRSTPEASGLEFSATLNTNPPAAVIDSSVVDLRDRKTDVIDPARVRGNSPALEKPRNNARELLDALEAGDGNWNQSLSWLKNRVVTEPANGPARDAYQFMLGLSQGLGEQNPILPLSDTKLPDMPGTTWAYKDPSTHETLFKALVALDREDYATAYKQFRLARQQEPDHLGVRDCMNWSEGMLAAHGNPPADLFSDRELQEMLGPEPADPFLDRELQEMLVPEIDGDKSVGEQDRAARQKAILERVRNLRQQQNR